MTLDIPCDAQFLVTLQREARQATPAHRQPSLSLKQITIYYISCLYRLSPCPPGILGLEGNQLHSTSQFSRLHCASTQKDHLVAPSLIQRLDNGGERVKGGPVANLGDGRERGHR